MDSNINKIKIGNDTFYICFKHNHPKDNLEISLYDTSNASWNGIFNKEDAEAFLIHENLSDYYEKVIKILTSNDNTYMYDLVVEENNATFIWKEKFEKSTAVRIHGEVKLSKTTDTKDTLIDILMQENQTLQKNLLNYKKELKSLNEELISYKTELQKVIDIKKSLESTLYGKLLQLLNEKNARIEVLEDQGNPVQDNSSTCVNDESD